MNKRKTFIFRTKLSSGYLHSALETVEGEAVVGTSGPALARVDEAVVVLVVSIEVVEVVEVVAGSGAGRPGQV